ncbi:PLP-dependent aminotransferase family protein [Streptomyces varsoviensis]|uniref:aminotransferase-like domain-containing protein n=1 Tax=Streptomyces varsoviensis TaxID=67373 RepID=UPI003401215F
MNSAQGLLAPHDRPTAAAWSAVAGRLGESTMGDVLRWGAGGSVNFAGGFPDERLFPMWHVREAMEAVLTRHGPRALQYGSAQGAEWVRDAVAGHLERRGVLTSPETVLLTSGGQQAIDLVARLYVDPGDVVVTTSPTYFAALELFEAAGAEIVTVPLDEGGLDLDRLDAALGDRRAKVCYLITDHQNPTGISLPAGQRPLVADLLRRHACHLIEDDVFGDIAFEPPAPPIQRWAPDRVSYVTSFSKGLSPGLRAGVLAAPADVIGKALALRENTDVCPNTLTHAVMGELLHSGAYHRLLPRLCDRYRTRRDALLSALESHLAGRAHWTTARGGFFTWVTLDAPADVEELLRTAARSGVVFLPGARFRRGEKNGGERAELRLSCARLDPAEIEEGIGRLAGLL